MLVGLLVLAQGAGGRPGQGRPAVVCGWRLSRAGCCRRREETCGLLLPWPGRWLLRPAEERPAAGALGLVALRLHRGDGGADMGVGEGGKGGSAGGRCGTQQVLRDLGEISLGLGLGLDRIIYMESYWMLG